MRPACPATRRARRRSGLRQLAPGQEEFLGHAWQQFQSTEEYLIPPADAALSALLVDLAERGLLEDTIVAWVGEFGRKPEITPANSGREHWPYCYSGLLAGGGISGGAIFGSSDRHAAYPLTNPVSPHDYAATLLHTLGVSRDTILHDFANRPHRIYAGQPIEALFG
jgi:uncharacterized protein (DUF1501 family)